MTGAKVLSVTVALTVILLRSVHATPPTNPISVTQLSVDSVGIGLDATITVRVQANQDLHDVEGLICDGDGFTIVSQLDTKTGILEAGKTTMMHGTIQPTQSGV